MNIPYHGLSVDIEIRNIIEITRLELQQELNQHGRLSITCLISGDQPERLFIDAVAETKVKLSDSEKVIFYGYLSFIDVFQDRSQWVATIEFSSMSKKIDICKKSRVFSDQNDKYIDVIEKVLQPYPNFQVWDEISEAKSISGLLLQYEETDWTFLVRLASHFSSFVVVTNENAGIHFGIPESNSHIVLNQRDYVIVQDMEYSNRNLQLDNHEFDLWKINSSKYLKIGDRILFHGVLAIVMSAHIYEMDGELIKEYVLQQEEGLKTTRKYNFEMLGLSLPATVIDRKENKVQVQFDVNQPYPPEIASKYFIYGIESSSFYCIPEKGSRVHIYFPGKFEGDAIAVHALNTGDGLSRNPSDKSFSAPSGSGMNMTPTNYRFKSDKDKASVLNLGADGTIGMMGKNITIEAVNLISFGAGEKINTLEMVSHAELEQTIMVADPSSSIAIDSELKIISDKIFMKAQSGNLSAEADAIREQLTEGDNQLIDDYNNEQQEKLREREQELNELSIKDISDITAKESENDGGFFSGWEKDEWKNNWEGNIPIYSKDFFENKDLVDAIKSNSASKYDPYYYGTNGSTNKEKNEEVADAVGEYNGIIGANVEGGYSKERWKGGGEEGDWWEAQVSSKVYASAGVSIGGFKDPDAKAWEFWKYKGVGVGASAKAGASVINAEGTARLLGLENEIINFNGKGEVSFLKAEIGADVGLGIVDGKFKLGAEAEAGLYLVEGEVSGSVTLVGVDVGGKLSGKIGLGIEGKFGYNEGKIKAKVGAAVLIGGSAEVEIDISNVTKGWNQLCDVVSGWWDDWW